MYSVRMGVITETGPVIPVSLGISGEEVDGSWEEMYDENGQATGMERRSFRLNVADGRVDSVDDEEMRELREYGWNDGVSVRRWADEESASREYEADMSEDGEEGGNEVPVLGEDEVTRYGLGRVSIAREEGWWSNEDPVGGTTYNHNRWYVRRGGGNEVPVEGEERNQMCMRLYCDDGVVMNMEQVLRLCVIVRILTLLMTMELVLIGYICSVFDVIQWRRNNQASLGEFQRERVICGAAYDGGVSAARNVHSNNVHADSFANIEAGGEEGDDLKLGKVEEEDSVEHEIHDDEPLEPKLELTRDQDQK